MKVLHKGEIFEQVFLNEPEVNLHIVQEAGSRVKIHLINVQRDNVPSTKARKILIEDKLFIMINGLLYDATGKVVK